MNVISSFQGTALLHLTAIAYIGRQGQSPANLFSKIGAHGIAKFAGTAALFLTGWLIYAQIILGTAFSVKATVADPIGSGLGAWSRMIPDFSGDGRGAFPKGPGNCLDGVPPTEQMLYLTAFLIS